MAPGPGEASSKAPARRPLTTPVASSSSISTIMSPVGEVDRTSLFDIEHAGRDYGSVSENRKSRPGTPGLPPHRKFTKAKLKKRLKYYIPGFAWIPNYSLSFLGGDVLAGLTVASMLIPQSVSYASSLAHLSPSTGLFAAVFPAIAYAFLGTSRQLNVAPEAALSLLVGQSVNEVLHETSNPHFPRAETAAMAVATVITLQVGLISFLLGFFRLGFIDVVLSRALLRGFVAAIAVIIMIEQLIPMFGLTSLEPAAHPETTLDKFFFLIENIFTRLHPLTAIVSFAALGVLVFLRSFKRLFKRWWFIYRIPEVLVVVVVSTILSARFHWDEDGMDILGDVPIKTGRHFFEFPAHHNTLKYLRETTTTAVVISVIGFLDSIVAAKQSAARFGYSISPNRELVALGAANLLASFVPGTLPAYGSITRTRINGDVGGRTQLGSLVCAGLVLLATFFLLPWLYYLPTSVLASIICLVVFSLLAETPHELHFYWKMSAWADLALFTLTFVLSIVWNVEVGVVVSLIISLLMVVHRSSKTRMTILGRLPGTDRWKPIDETVEAEDVPGVLVVRIRDNLDFANTAQLKERLRRLELYGQGGSHPSEEPSMHEASVLVFHLADMDSCDASAVQIFYELLEEYQSRNVGLFITHLRPGPRKQFVKAGIMDLLGPESFQENVGDAMARIEMRAIAAAPPLP